MSAPLPSANPDASVRRELSLLDCFGIGINGILGSGIFLLPAVVHRTAGGRGPLAWLLIGGLCSLVALCFAEAAGRTDRSGGPYRYASEAFGSTFGFVVGWVTLVSSALGYTAVVRGFGQAAAALLGHAGHRPVELALSLSVIATLTAVNFAGVRPGARTGDVLSFVKIGSILAFVGIGLFSVDLARLSAAPAPLPGERAGILGAAMAGLFATTGFEFVPVPAGETRNPQRTVPLAMVISVLGATALYALVQLVAAGTHPQLGQSTLPLVEAAGSFGGPRGQLLMNLAFVTSAYGFCASSALVGPRYLELFARDGFLPPLLAYRSPRRQTPVVAIALLSSGVALLLIVALTLPRLWELARFESLASISNVAVVVQYMATGAAVLVLRRTRKEKGAFTIPFGPLVPVLALLGSCSFLFYVGRTELVVAGVFVAIGLLFGGLYRRRGQAAGRGPLPVAE